MSTTQTKPESKVTNKISVEKPSREAPELNVPVGVDSASPQQVNIMSQQDSYVSDLVKEQPKDVTTVEINDASFVNILELPEECAALHKVKYRFKWMAKNKNLEAKLRTGIFIICTRENAPFIKLTRFKSHGAVEQAGMLLAFAREDVGASREAAPAKKSAALVKHYTKELPNRADKGFYKPEGSGGDDEGADGFEMDF